MRNKQKGITLVALVVTIIILLILAGISIASLTNNGLFENAKLAKEKSDNAQEKEEGILGDYENRIDLFLGGKTREETLDLTGKIKLIGKKMGTKIEIPTGYKYVVISNHYWTSTSIDCVNISKLANNTNSSIILQESTSSYNSKNGGGWLIVAQIIDTSKEAIFTMSGSDYNFVYGIEE